MAELHTKLTTSIPKLAAVIPRGNNTFESQNVADRMGNLAPIAYGGSTLAFAINCASATVKSTYHIYSSMGNFLGPVLTDRKMFCTVQSIRDTKSFATRDIRVSQVYPDGKARVVLTMLADFQVAETASLFTYSAKPTMSYPPVAEIDLSADHLHKLIEDGHITEKELAIFEKLFSSMGRYFDIKPCPQGVGSQNLVSLAKHVKTSQDHLSLPEKSSADWYRHREPLETQADSISAMFYLLDGAISFAPLTHSHLTLSDASACSSLDFALRVFSNDVKLDQWHLRELKTVAGGNGRTYSEARLWDEGGNMVASMTQQCIMRPLPDKKAKAKL